MKLRRFILPMIFIVSLLLGLGYLLSTSNTVYIVEKADCLECGEYVVLVRQMGFMRLKHGYGIRRYYGGLGEWHFGYTNKRLSYIGWHIDAINELDNVVLFYGANQSKKFAIDDVREYLEGLY